MSKNPQKNVHAEAHFMLSIFMLAFECHEKKGTTEKGKA
jgi:hypothetical protein